MNFCNRCEYLGLDFETGKFYCSLSHRPDDLPKNLICEEFVLDNYIKYLKRENMEMKEEIVKKKKAFNKITNLLKGHKLADETRIKSILEIVLDEY